MSKTWFALHEIFATTQTPRLHSDCPILEFLIAKPLELIRQRIPSYDEVTKADIQRFAGTLSLPNPWMSQIEHVLRTNTELNTTCTVVNCSAEVRDVVLNSRSLELLIHADDEDDLAVKLVLDWVATTGTVVCSSENRAAKGGLRGTIKFLEGWRAKAIA